MRALLVLSLLAAGPAGASAPGAGSTSAAKALQAGPATGAPLEVEPASAAKAPQEIDLQSETLVVEHRAQRAIFGGGVVATRGDLEVRCPTVTALYDQRARVREVRCEGPVTATQGGKAMASRAGSFDNTAGQLHLQGETTLTEAGRRFSGESLDYEVSTSVATLTRAEADLSGSADLGAGRTDEAVPFRITADKVVHDFDRHRTTFSGNVVATRGDLVMRASRLVVVGTDDGRVDRAWTEGGPVRVVQGERQGSAQKGTFVGGGKRLVLEGDPVVTENDSSLRGDRVTFFVGKGRVEVEKPRAVFPLKRAKGDGE